MLLNKISCHINQTKSVNQNESINQTEPATETPVAEQKFRVGPTVVLRPVNDVITKDEDGLVELYVDNPSLNDVTLNVDARISVPSGIHATYHSLRSDNCSYDAQEKERDIKNVCLLVYHLIQKICRTRVSNKKCTLPKIIQNQCYKYESPGF